MQLYLDFFLDVARKVSNMPYLGENIEKYHQIWWYFVELIAGFEPATSSLPRSYPKFGEGKTRYHIYASCLL